MEAYTWAYLNEEEKKQEDQQEASIGRFEMQGYAKELSMLQSAPKSTQLWNYHKQDEEVGRGWGGGDEKKNENTHSAAYIRGQECQLRKQFCMVEIEALAPLRVGHRDRKQINSQAMKNDLERQIRQKTKIKITAVFDGGARGNVGKS